MEIATKPDSANAIAVIEPEHVSEPSPKRDEAAANNREFWIPTFISIIALLASGFSLALELEWIRPHEDHDVVARVLGVSAFTKGFSEIETNGELVVELALVNRGNQTEIIRDGFLCYSDNKELNGQRGHSYQRNFQRMNIQLARGEKRVVRLSSPFNDMNTGKRMWLGVVVGAVAPNADDTETVWPVCEINLAPDGNGAWVSYNKQDAPLMEIISNVRTLHQRRAQDGL